MIIYSLYIKTHNKTGLMYLGYTSKTDVHSYTGSGYYWLDHCKKHGFDYKTEILCTCINKEEVKKIGLYYSKLWNIVYAKDNSGKKIWANLKEEAGDGNTSEDAKSFWTDERRQSQSMRTTKKNKKRWENKEFREKMSDRAVEWSKKLWQDPNYKDIQSKTSSARVKGTNHPLFDHTIYHFVHETGCEEHCTRYHLYKKYGLHKDSITKLVKNIQSSCKGWRLKK